MHHIILNARLLAGALTATCGIFLALDNLSAQEKTIVIEEGKQVSFNYTLSSGGEEIESNKGQEPLTYIQGGGQILPALEEGLVGLAVGDTKEVELSAANAYGETDPGALQEVPADQVPESARQVGAMLQAEGFPGPIRVTEVREDVVVLDFNHPLAGKDLVFSVEILAIEDAPNAPAQPAQ